MLVYVIILNYKGKEDTVACVRSLFQMNALNFEVIIVDNCSPNDSVAYFQKHIPDIHVIETDTNLGYAGGNNVGIKYALKQGADAVLILNNDTIVDQNFLNGFLDTSKKYPGAVLGARIYQFGQNQLFQHFGGNWNNNKGKFINEPQKLIDDRESWETIKPLDFVCGCALFVPVSVFQKVGLFEESFFLYYEEIDWCVRAQKMGVPSLYCPFAVVWHKESASLKNPRPPQSYFQWRNRIYFIERNFSKRELIYWIITKLIYRVFVLAVKKWMKDLQYFFLFIFFKEKLTEKLRINRLAYKASLHGVKDYFFRQFGNGPKWIYQ